MSYIWINSFRTPQVHFDVGLSMASSFETFECGKICRDGHKTLNGSSNVTLQFENSRIVALRETILKIEPYITETIMINQTINNGFINWS
jgi:hypothetical protein